MKALALSLALLCTFFGVPSTVAEEPQKHFGYFKVGKGQIGEACPVLKKGQLLTYTVKSSKPVKFNFHYHKGEEVVYPVEDHETQLIEKTFTAEMDETYCLMWTGLADDTTVEIEYFVQDTVHPALPLTQATPRYPIKAYEDKIEGYVIVSFDIEPNGRTSNISIIEEVPEEIFSQVAKEAVQKWMFKPKVINQKPVKATDYSYKLEFTI